MRRRCSDDEDNAAIVRGATSRASGELSRLWRLETQHREALTGTTATWGWEAATENTVSKQTPFFSQYVSIYALTILKNYEENRLPKYVPLHTSISSLDVVLYVIAVTL
jgi:hypothetical protein